MTGSSVDVDTKSFCGNPWRSRTCRWLVTAWGLLVVAALGLNLLEVRRDVLVQARTMAHSALDKDIMYRRWAALHGGVYVPATEQTPPNPYLAHVPERDIETPAGRKLTLMNPAYMTRQVHELSRDDGSLNGHITSQEPLRPENRPFAWEDDMLQRLEQGANEVWAQGRDTNGPVLHYMRRLDTEERCLRCHAQQGYRVGDMRGGISVTVPLQPLWTNLPRHLLPLIMAHLLFLALGSIGIVLGFCHLQRRDAARRMAEQALAHSEAYYRTISEQATEGIVVASIATRTVRYVNPAFCDMMHAERAALLGRPVLSMHPPEMAEQLANDFQALARGKPDVLRRIPLLRADGTTLPVDIRARPVTMAGEDCLLGMLTDVSAQLDTERREQQLVQADKLTSLGTLVLSVAHEINNPNQYVAAILPVLREVCEALLPILDRHAEEKGDFPVGQSTYTRIRPMLPAMLRDAEQGAARIARISADLKEFAADSQTHALGPVNLNTVAETASRLLGARIRRATYHFTLDLAPVLPPVLGSIQRLEQVVINLIDNACLALTDPSQPICITTGSLAPVGRVYIEVRDEGMGMTPEQVSNLRQPFFTTRAGEGGTGLGFFISSRIVAEHGGDIIVWSAPGRGTTMRVLLPCDTGELPPKGDN